MKALVRHQKLEDGGSYVGFYYEDVDVEVLNPRDGETLEKFRQRARTYEQEGGCFLGYPPSRRSVVEVFG